MLRISVASFEPQRNSAVLQILSDETSPPRRACVRVVTAPPGGRTRNEELARQVRNYNASLGSKTLDEAVRALGGAPVDCPQQPEQRITYNRTADAERMAPVVALSIGFGALMLIGLYNLMRD